MPAKHYHKLSSPVPDSEEDRRAQNNPISELHHENVCLQPPTSKNSRASSVPPEDTLEAPLSTGTRQMTNVSPSSHSSSLSKKRKLYETFDEQYCQQPYTPSKHSTDWSTIHAPNSRGRLPSSSPFTYPRPYTPSHSRSHAGKCLYLVVILRFDFYF